MSVNAILILKITMICTRTRVRLTKLHIEYMFVKPHTGWHHVRQVRKMQVCAH